MRDEMHTDESMSTAGGEKPESIQQEEQQQIKRDRRHDKVQVARAVACCGAVARLYRRYGGAVRFVPMPTITSAKTNTPVKAPMRGYAVKRTIKGLR